MPHCNKQMISFFLTTKCNLRCVYCYNSKERAEKGEHSLDFEAAKIAINEYFKDDCGDFNIKLREPQKRHIRFYGPGEATEEEGFTLLKQITDYAKQKANMAGFELVTELQTNGAYNNEVRKWILENINLLWISFDGTPDIHNNQRPMLYYVDENDNDVTIDSSPVIVANIKWLFANKPNSRNNIMIGIRSTITNESIDKQKEMVDYFEELGVEYIWSDPEFPAVEDKAVCKAPKKLEQYNFDINFYVDRYIDAYRYAKKKDIFYGSFLACNFDNAKNGTTINCRCCIPVPHITPDGCVSACDLVILGKKANHMDCFVYGEWHEHSKQFILDADKIQALQNRNVDDKNMNNIIHCQKCKVRLHCAGYCPGEVVNETGKLNGRLHKEKRKVCQAINKLYDELYDEITEDLKNKTEYLNEGGETGFYPFPHP